jgi:hypothetical protein
MSPTEALLEDPNKVTADAARRVVGSSSKTTYAIESCENRGDFEGVWF